LFYKLCLIALAGGIGTLARYGLAGVAQRAFSGEFPAGTLAVNLFGCLLAGLVWALAESRLNFGGDMRAYVFVGFMGAFTTFSTYILETSELLRNGQWLLAGTNLVVHTFAGIALFAVGLSVGYRL